MTDEQLKQHIQELCPKLRPKLPAPDEESILRIQAMARELERLGVCSLEDVLSVGFVLGLISTIFSQMGHSEVAKDRLN